MITTFLLYDLEEPPDELAREKGSECGVRRVILLSSQGSGWGFPITRSHGLEGHNPSPSP